jgi:membrane-associated PAP2 superfamily phosphatase
LSTPALPLAPAGCLRAGAVALVASGLLILGLAQFSNLDLALADRSFDTALRQFMWRNDWFADVFMHRWLKVPLSVFGLALVLAALIDAVWRLPRLDAAGRWALRASAALALLVPLSISLAKRLSQSHCPWSLDRYGGHALYVRLLDALPAGIEPGGCFPAGHASSALWLVGLCLWWLPRRPRVAAAVFAAGLAAGLALGWVQQLRGAHFLSHTLASMWIAAALVWLVLLGFAQLQRSRLAVVPNTTRAWRW